MAMSMVQVREVGMIVLDRVVVMGVAVRFAHWVVWSVGVVMVFIVHVQVLVIRRVVAVQVGMPLTQECRYARRHEHHGQHVQSP